MKLRTALLLVFIAACWIVVMLLILPTACASTGPKPSIQILTSTATAKRLHSELEFDLWEALVVRDGELANCGKRHRGAQRKLEIRTVTVAAELQIPDCPQPIAAVEEPASNVRPLLAAGLVGLGLGIGATGLALPEQDQRRAALIVGGTGVALGVLLLTVEMIARAFQ